MDVNKNQNISIKYEYDLADYIPNANGLGIVFKNNLNISGVVELIFFYITL